jgi:hypothetical protein
VSGAGTAATVTEQAEVVPGTPAATVVQMPAPKQRESDETSEIHLVGLLAVNGGSAGGAEGRRLVGSAAANPACG